jgi:hypothetical protein
VVYRGPALTDRFAFVILERQQCLVERIGDAGVDQSDTARTKPGAVLQFVAANQFESILMVALGAGVQLLVAAIGAIFGKYPVERSDSCDRWLAAPITPLIRPGLKTSL